MTTETKTYPRLVNMTDDELRQFVLTQDRYHKEMAAISELVTDGDYDLLSSGQRVLLNFLDREVPSELNFCEVIAHDNPPAWGYRLGQIQDWIEQTNGVQVTFETHEPKKSNSHRAKLSASMKEYWKRVKAEQE